VVTANEDNPGHLSPPICRLLHLRIEVFEARLVYPTDQVLQQLDQTLDERTSLSRGAKRRILPRSREPLAELQPGD
jgi:hypothetical protein